MIGFTTAECSLIDQATKDLKPADGNQRELRTVRDCIKEVVKGGEVLLHFTGEQLQTLIRALERKEMIETRETYHSICMTCSGLSLDGCRKPPHRVRSYWLGKPSALIFSFIAYHGSPISKGKAAPAAWPLLIRLFRHGVKKLGTR